MLNWNARLRILTPTGTGTGSQDDEGNWVPDPGGGDQSVVYNDLADVQDVGLSLNKDQFGTGTEASDAIAFLYRESLLPNIKLQAIAEITYIKSGMVEKAVVQKIRVMDGTLLLKRL